MLIPASYYGLTRDVKKRAQKAVRALKAGKSLREAVQADDLIDTREQPGLIVLRGPNPLVGGEPHFHCYLVLRELLEAEWANPELRLGVEETFLQSSFKEPWSLLGLLASSLATFFYSEIPARRKRHIPFLNACLQLWPVIVAEGERYSLGSNSGAAIGRLPTNLDYVLANRGVTMEEMDRYLPAGELAPLIELALQRSGEI